jgi:hypothetical protein
MAQLYIRQFQLLAQREDGRAKLPNLDLEFPAPGAGVIDDCLHLGHCLQL